MDVNEAREKALKYLAEVVESENANYLTENRIEAARLILASYHNLPIPAQNRSGSIK